MISSSDRSLPWTQACAWGHTLSPQSTELVVVDLGGWTRRLCDGAGVKDGTNGSPASVAHERRVAEGQQPRVGGCIGPQAAQRQPKHILLV